MANSMLNFASRPVCGWWLRSTLVLRRLVMVAMLSISSALSGCSASRSSIPSRHRWVQKHSGYFLTESLAVSSFQTLPVSTGNVTSARPPGDTADRKPWGCSSASGDEVNPALTSLAAMTPDCAERPAWNGLVMVPKLAMMPALCDAPSEMASAHCSASSLLSDAQAAAAATAPRIPVGCQPLV